jgi:hypothetical protein
MRGVNCQEIAMSKDQSPRKEKKKPKAEHNKKKKGGAAPPTAGAPAKPTFAGFGAKKD